MTKNTIAFAKFLKECNYRSRPVLYGQNSEHEQLIKEGQFRLNMKKTCVIQKQFSSRMMNRGSGDVFRDFQPTVGDTSIWNLTVTKD